MARTLRRGAARCDAPGVWQIGIYSVEKRGTRWYAVATGPGTIGDGKVSGHFPNLRAAYRFLTGERMPGAAEARR